MSTIGVPAIAPVKLFRDKKEQEVLDGKAELYAIIKATEKLERAYVRDAINPDQYETACERLIAQFRVLKNSLTGVVPDVEAFMREYNMQCPLAATRLLHSGLPATIEHKSKARTNDPEAASVAEAVQHFITAMDSLKLNMVAVDQICPILNDLMTSIMKVPSLENFQAPKEKVKEWYSKLYQKPATYELRDEESRQMLYDLESSYNSFITSLKSRSG
mmetsp:Transcript_14228/g.35155  ORF Transcript_14228/g.35155 Transcript_14228/m.35155 type:complete len:218 (-) Transcript_14228:349-1002(-)|eukprot:CAMPEP_0202866066 /NCGR_PEP_ID=MMETSP1391-20130828/7182_1 /ASSEMBLY_ACC=CAM_ASM_000867 /TAXON_ID=1034604 /ORGANISM="Chlamydomonas leiostraca, Strain SAG 11-49" /LENGTH=217 /DNA_ID=CAMNT_0049545981 /DNA_START=56 /DNA_END=709 /DNA_ORIENTATION=-